MTGLAARNALAWMLVAQVAVLAPMLLRFPWWISVVCFCCGLWRVLIYQQRSTYPHWSIKAIFVFLTLAGLLLQWKSLLSLEPWIGLLLLMFSLKLLEMQRVRDVYQAILLGYFVALTHFLYDQSFLSSCYTFACVLMITAGLVGCQQVRADLRPWLPLQKAAVLIFQAVPLMLVFFVLFPRLAPLWSIPQAGSMAVTGISDQMRMGSISELTQSSKLAFRATFADRLPGSQSLYWRGLVLNEFDGETWSRQSSSHNSNLYRSGRRAPQWLSDREVISEPVRYRILMEPSQQKWLFTLPMVMPAANWKIGLSSEQHLVFSEPIRNRIGFNVQSALRYRVDTNLSQSERAYYLRLPAEGNPQSRSFARRLNESSADKQAVAEAVLAFFRQEQFYYTLRPGRLEGETIDQFLFASRRGFCGHFASSFTFLMRAAGIPARVVVGYQGGEFNPVGNYIEVRQFDAHAWSEIWLQGLGWVRMDPTAAVAPERIELGIEAALQEEGSFLENIPVFWLKLRGFAWLTEVRFQIGAWSHYWNSFVVGYDPVMQLNLLSRFWEGIQIQDLAHLTLLSFVAMMFLLAIVLLRSVKGRHYSEIVLVFNEFSALFALLGYPRLKHEGPLDYCHRLALQRPDLAEAINEFSEHYIARSYAGDPAISVKALKRRIFGLRLRLLKPVS
ncbi:MAG: DUF3488 domain-containing protein [Gammaproteobacteria bacterium]|jgi:protein-glutamine gamma-glutamyltransferase|nr:DUF3488 domain-containing protein [Gammaproteobacteria bacterium]MBT5602438.1 DUF3488 domain-containing protein [Gammaproteobacteria bacterium]MBT6245226.1 DUF3488 domain-containing protein [Gammaproteobacteria bacterium]